MSCNNGFDLEIFKCMPYRVGRFARSSFGKKLLVMLFTS